MPITLFPPSTPPKPTTQPSTNTPETQSQPGITSSTNTVPTDTPQSVTNATNAAPTDTQPTLRSTGTNADTQPTLRSTGTNADTQPTLRSTGTNADTQPTLRSTGTNTDTQPTLRSTGTNADTQPTLRSTGTNADTQPTLRSTGTNADTQPTLRSTDTQPTLRSTGTNADTQPTLRSTGTNANTQPTLRSTGTNADTQPTLKSTGTNAATDTTEAAKSDTKPTAKTSTTTEAAKSDTKPSSSTTDSTQPGSSTTRSFNPTPTFTPSNAPPAIAGGPANTAGGLTTAAIAFFATGTVLFVLTVLIAAAVIVAKRRNARNVRNARNARDEMVASPAEDTQPSFEAALQASYNAALEEVTRAARDVESEQELFNLAPQSLQYRALENLNAARTRLYKAQQNARSIARQLARERLARDGRTEEERIGPITSPLSPESRLTYAEFNPNVNEEFGGTAYASATIPDKQGVKETDVDAAAATAGSQHPQNYDSTLTQPAAPTPAPGETPSIPPAPQAEEDSDSSVASSLMEFDGDEETVPGAAAAAAESTGSAAIQESPEILEVRKKLKVVAKNITKAMNLQKSATSERERKLADAQLIAAQTEQARLNKLIIDISIRQTTAPSQPEASGYDPRQARGRRTDRRDPSAFSDPDIPEITLPGQSGNNNVFTSPEPIQESEEIREIRRQVELAAKAISTAVTRQGLTKEGSRERERATSEVTRAKDNYTSLTQRLNELYARQASAASQPAAAAASPSEDSSQQNRAAIIAAAEAEIIREGRKLDKAKQGSDARAAAAAKIAAAKDRIVAAGGPLSKNISAIVQSSTSQPTARKSSSSTSIGSHLSNLSKRLGLFSKSSQNDTTGLETIDEELNTPRPGAQNPRSPENAPFQQPSRPQLPGGAPVPKHAPPPPPTQHTETVPNPVPDVLETQVDLANNTNIPSEGTPVTLDDAVQPAPPNNAPAPPSYPDAAAAPPPAYTGPAAPPGSIPPVAPTGPHAGSQAQNAASRMRQQLGIGRNDQASDTPGAPQPGGRSRESEV